MANKMAYIPPQKRSTYVRQNRVNLTSKTEFPQLAQPKNIESKMDFKKLFKHVELKRQKRENRMKKGWVKLTRNGVVDSLTPQERADEDEWNLYYKTQQNLDVLVNTWDKHRAMRLERDGYLSDYSVDPPSEEEESESESEEEESEEEDILDYDTKWFTS